MGQRTLGFLLAVNAMLLFALGFVTLGTPEPALAQALGRPNYLMIAGEVTGRSNQAAIYVVDLNTSRVIAGFFNASTNRFEFIAARDLTSDLAQGQNTQRRSRYQPLERSQP